MRNKNVIAIICAGVVLLMTGAAFAAVPLYQLFCQVTGFGGTTMVADKPSDVILDQTVLVRFDTNVRGLPMTFRAEQVSQRVRIGETGIAYFDVTNTSDRPIHATAAYNVVPERPAPISRSCSASVSRGRRSRRARRRNSRCSISSPPNWPPTAKAGGCARSL